MRGSLRKFALPLLLILYVACLFGATAWFQDGLFERDGYYHARFARMMPERGLSRHFPWTQISTWMDSFCDKEFLYHLAMMPFAQIGKEPIFGARLFACLLSMTVVVTLFCVLRANRARWPAFFAALPLAMGGLFIARLGMIRSHVLSMLLILLGVHFLFRGPIQDRLTRSGAGFSDPFNGWRCYDFSSGRDDKSHRPDRFRLPDEKSGEVLCK